MDAVGQNHSYNTIIIIIMPLHGLVIKGKCCLVVGKSLYLMVIDFSELWDNFFVQQYCYSMCSAIQYSTD